MKANRNPALEQFTTLGEWLSWLENLHHRKIDLSLGRVKAVLSAMELEQPPYGIITIGGTNGKGSCVAILESIYVESGYRVGAFTSPHLWKFNERVRVNRRDATDDELIAAFRAIDSVRGDVTLSYFEYSTLVAIVFFATSGVDVAILEVGLGGRLDAVNALNPDASMIVSIDLDHEKWLGDTRDAIGVEKAGILRPGRPAVIADRAPPNSLFDYASDHAIELQLLGRDFDYDVPSEEAWRYTSVSAEVSNLPVPSFGGSVRFANAAACIALVHSLQDKMPFENFALARGIMRTQIVGRIERRYLNGVEWIFDVAHNPAAARILAEELQRRKQPGKTIAIFAAMADKDIFGLIDPLLPFIDHWLVTRADLERGATENTLIDVLAERCVVPMDARTEVADACGCAKNLAEEGDRVLVFGSFYIVGPAMTWLGLYCAPSLPDD